MQYTLRRPQTIDYDAVASWVTDADACARWAGPHLPFPFSASDLPALLSIAGMESHCLADGPAACHGFGQYWVFTPDTVHLGRIIVAPTVRGRGVGRLLCQQLITAALHKTGAERITLRVYRSNTPAATLYSSLGFVAVESESTEEVQFMEAVVRPIISLQIRA